MGMRFLVVARLAFHPEARINELDKAYEFGYCIMDRIEKHRCCHRNFGAIGKIKDC
jgi:hypothetical protein